MNTLPDQNQIYAYYVTRCGHHGVRKPHKAVLALLAEDTTSHALRLGAEAAARQVEAADLALTEDGEAAAAYARARAAVVPLREQRTFRLSFDSGAGLPIYVGARGMLPVLDVVAELPQLTELDFSTVASWFANDNVNTERGGGVTGNDVVRRLCEILPRLPALRVVRLRGHPIGCAAGAWLLDALRHSPGVVELEVEESGLSVHLLRALQQCVEEHREAAAAAVAAACSAPQEEISAEVSAAYTVPSYIAALPRLDRKTLREQQVLRAMLEVDPNFSGVVAPDELAEMVLTAHVMSTTEAIFRCGRGGVRGDGVHLFVIKSGALRVHEDLAGSLLGRGDYFGDAYPDAVVPCSHLIEEERGVVYAIPLTSCGELLSRWAARVAEARPWLQRTPLLQPVGSWTRQRACTCCERVRKDPAETIVEVGSGEGDIFVVCDGTYAALDVRDGDTAQFSERNVRCTFSRYDVLGVEAVVARKHSSSVRIKAGKEKDVEYVLLRMRGCAVRLLRQQLRQVFVSLARSYSLHPDLCAEAPHSTAAGAE